MCIRDRTWRARTGLCLYGHPAKGEHRYAGGYYLTVNDGSSVYLIDSSTYYLPHKDSSCFEAADEEESTEAADQEYISQIRDNSDQG